MKRISILLTLSLIAVALSACRGGPPPNQPGGQPPQRPGDQGQNPPSNQPSGQAQNQAAETSGAVTVKADVWADNWFAFYLGEQLVMEDSVPITAERSFNAESFTFHADYPMTFNFIAKDFKENDTGLEYIGTNKQQMGDGGLIAQFVNADTGEVIAVTNSNWKCMVIHEAPLDKACEKSSNPIAGEMPCGFTALEEPSGWKSVGFEDSSWSAASIYSAQQVGPKDGYDQISWESSAQFIWGPDLETNNTILCRLTVTK